MELLEEAEPGLRLMSLVRSNKSEKRKRWCRERERFERDMKISRWIRKS